MYCKNCGGKLIANEGYFICESCHSKSNLTNFYENEEVYIAYIETDEYGRRTKDSVIAQEIYHKLEGAEIKTFFQRISASNITDDAIESICAAAAEKAKIILIIATTSEHFGELLEKYKNITGTKTILPIFSDIPTSSLPQEIKRLQALNYDAIGSGKDLIRSILHILERDNEIELFDDKRVLKQRKKRWTIITALLIVLIGFLTYLITCTPYFLKSKKYEYANDLTARGDYVQAIQILCNIPDYKDSKTMLLNTYKLYDGTYTDESGNIGVQLDISDVNFTNIKVIRNLVNDSMSVFSETVGINENAIQGSYKDTSGISGEFGIWLKNDGIQVVIYQMSMNEKIKDVDIFIPFENKSEEKVSLKVHHEQILSWLNGDTTINKLASKGYDIENKGFNEYKIKNTDISIACNSTGMIESISGPADILCPEYVNQESVPYYMENILCCPNDGLYWAKSDAGETITSDYIVTIASKQSLGDRWEYVIEGLNQDEDDVNFVYIPIGNLKKGMTTREVQRILGDPEEKGQEVGQAATGESLQSWEYPSIGIEIVFTRDGAEQKISSIHIKEPCNFATPQGIRIGSSRTEVRNAYKGKIDEEMSTNSQIIVGSIYGGTIFSMENDRVSEIFVGAGAE